VATDAERRKCKGDHANPALPLLSSKENT